MKVNIRELTLKKKIQETVTWQKGNKNEAKSVINYDWNHMLITKNGYKTKFASNWLHIDISKSNFQI